MAIPGYQELMLPLLHIAGDGKLHSVSEAMSILAHRLEISEADRNALLPSGTQTRFYNRVTWALTYLSKCSLITKPSRGHFRISERGVEVLSSNPGKIDNAYLSRYPEFKEFKSKRAAKAWDARKSDDAGTVASIDDEAIVTPDERLEAAYKELRETLADDLMERVRASTPAFFEQLVVDVLVAMGYGGSRMDAAQVVGKSGDGGIDGVIKEDKLGLDMVYIQAKRWNERSVGPDDIRQFVGSLSENKAHKGVFITCGTFTSGAREAAARANTRIVLIDGDQLAEYMIDFGVGVAEHKSYSVKKLDNDYFEVT